MADSPNVRARKNMHRTELCKQLLPVALKFLAAMHADPQRPKFTHHLLANGLEIPGHVAYRLAIAAARVSPHLTRIKNGPIYWKDEKVAHGAIFDALQAAESKKPREKP